MYSTISPSPNAFGFERDGRRDDRDPQVEGGERPGVNGRRARRGRCVDDRLEVPAPAKLNLFLHVVGRRPDAITTFKPFFQFVDLADRVRIARRNDTRLRRTSAIPGVDEADDLVVRAARMLRNASGAEKRCGHRGREADSARRRSRRREQRRSIGAGWD